MSGDDNKPLERLAEAYSVMLERANEIIEEAEAQARPAFEQAVERAQETARELGELSREEARLVGDYLRRDMRELGQHMAESGKDLRDWFQFDVQQIERRMWERLSAVADRTALELMRFSAAAGRRSEQYRSGEITGPGTLICDACGAVQNFDKPTAIPDCPRCGAGNYHRPA